MSGHSETLKVSAAGLVHDVLAAGPYELIGLPDDGRQGILSGDRDTDQGALRRIKIRGDPVAATIDASMNDPRPPCVYRDKAARNRRSAKRHSSGYHD